MPRTFVVVEGPDGSGKTTLATTLVDRLLETGQSVIHVREPGGTPSAELLRDLVLNHGEYDWSDPAELFLILAARAELVQKVIRPALQDGGIVVSDRFELSTIAYQAIGRQLGRTAVEATLRLASGGLTPDLTLVLDVEPGVGQARQAVAGKPPDRIEQAAQDLHDRVSAFYAGVRGDGVVHIDANQDAAGVAGDAWEAVTRYLAEQGTSRQGLKERQGGNR